MPSHAKLPALLGVTLNDKSAKQDGQYPSARWALSALGLSELV